MRDSPLPGTPVLLLPLSCFLHLSSLALLLPSMHPLCQRHLSYRAKKASKLLAKKRNAHNTNELM